LRTGLTKTSKLLSPLFLADHASPMRRFLAASPLLLGQEHDALIFAGSGKPAASKSARRCLIPSVNQRSRFIVAASKVFFACLYFNYDTKME